MKNRGGRVFLACRMPIAITRNHGKNVFLIELQGTIELLGTDLHVGEIGFDNQVPFLTIGNHIIQGQRVKLKNPMLVMEKEKEKDQLRLNCVKVVREKLLFKSRPEHVIDRSLLK
jgi:hypothetical protein